MRQALDTPLSMVALFLLRFIAITVCREMAAAGSRLANSLSEALDYAAKLPGVKFVALRTLLRLNHGEKNLPPVPPVLRGLEATALALTLALGPGLAKVLLRLWIRRFYPCWAEDRDVVERAIDEFIDSLASVPAYHTSTTTQLLSRQRALDPRFRTEFSAGAEIFRFQATA